MTNSLNCPVCNNLCSIQAASCPKCGHPINQINQRVATSINSILGQFFAPQTLETLRILLYIFIPIVSLTWAIGALTVIREMPLPNGRNDATILAAEINIAFRIGQLVIVAAVAAIIYFAKKRPQ